MIFASHFIAAALAVQSRPTVEAPARRVSEWEVVEDREGCTASVRYNDGTSFILGYDSYERDGYIFLGNASWRSVVEGRDYPFVLDMPPFAPMSLRGRGRPIEGQGGFTISFIGVDFIAQLMEAETMSVQTGRNVVGRYELSGSYAAAMELARCNRRALARVREDPFAQ